MTRATRLDRADWRPMHNRILLALGIGWALDSLASAFSPTFLVFLV
ncbi:MAG: hypothetical protein ACRDTA_17260 [Pseudonocardiaceae bacterium]